MPHSSQSSANRSPCSSGTLHLIHQPILSDSDLVSLIFRGQQFLKGFPMPSNYIEFYSILILLCLIHVGIMVYRDSLRSCLGNSSAIAFLSGIDCSNPIYGSNASAYNNTDRYHYTDLHYSVYIVLVLSGVLSFCTGFYINQDDYHHYRRYLQFLRLEFDTRLGMHSPR